MKIMASNRRKVSSKIKQERAKHLRALEREKDTIYWLVFVPKPDIVVPPDEQRTIWNDPWRIRVEGNPERYPQLIEHAIKLFEAKFQVNSWHELAVRFYPYGLYYP